MRKYLFLMTVVFFLLGHIPGECAFNSGSTGADGAFSPATNTVVQVPASGILNYTTVNISVGVTVTFTNNASNTPVYILATGDVMIAGIINVNGTDASGVFPGKGGPGGFAGGLGGPINTNGGQGLGPGGGNPSTYYSATLAGSAGGGGYSAIGGNGTFPNFFTFGANPPNGAGGGSYGNVNILPVIGGSGGGGGAGNNLYTGGGGGGGGGAIVIASSGTITLSGSITANGGKGANGTYTASTATCTGNGGTGSGGAVNLTADKIAGSGTITASGNSQSSTYCGSGGAGANGRIRLEANNGTGSIVTTPTSVFGYPSTVFVANIPTLSITSVGGVNVPVNPTGAYGSPDITLPSTTSNPVAVAVTATNIPIGTTITVTSVPEYGVSTSATGTLGGTVASSTTVAQLNLSIQYPCVLTSSATFTVQTAMYYQGEKIEKVAVASAIGKGTEVTYITGTGKHVKAEELIAMAARR